jgi:hypothetical protein
MIDSKLISSSDSERGASPRPEFSTFSSCFAVAVGNNFGLSTNGSTGGGAMGCVFFVFLRGTI